MRLGFRLFLFSKIAQDFHSLLAHLRIEQESLDVYHRHSGRSD
jgi:hypothetical protein